jgi:hypothetical protein
MTVSDDGIGGSGYSLEDLSDYLDRGRSPAIPEIDTNAECQAVLASLERMGALSRSLVEEEATEVDETWFDGLMREVAREVRAGRDIPLAASEPATQLVVTEGAIRALVRELGDALPGVVVERTRIEGDVTDAGAEVSVQIAISVGFGRSLPHAADEVRRVARSAIERHTGRRVTTVDVTVDALHGPDGEGNQR